MVYLHEQMKRLNFDVRLKELNVRRGAVSDTEWAKYLKDLPDLKEQTIKVDISEDNDSSDDR